MLENLLIVWRGVDASVALQERIAHHVDALGARGTCRVIVARPHRRRRHGPGYQVNISLGPVAVSHHAQREGEDAYAAVNAAFGKLERRLAAKGSRRRAVRRRQRRGRA